MYYTHLDPHVGPHVSKLSTAAAPYSSSFTKNIYTPYIRPALEYVIPGAAFLAPIPPKSFWAMMFDFLPSPGTSHVAEHKGQNQMNNFYADLHSAEKPASIPVPNAKKAPAKKGEDKEGKMDRAEMERVREAIRVRVKEQGQKGYNKVHAEVN
jgi:hypothetical protein